MRIFSRSRGETSDRQYIIVISGQDMTLNIECGTNDPESYLKKMVKRVKDGLTETIGYLTLMPVGDTVILNIVHNGLTMRKTLPLGELGYGNNERE